jgi:hypothetical protein
VLAPGCARACVRACARARAQRARGAERRALLLLLLLLLGAGGVRQCLSRVVGRRPPACCCRRVASQSHVHIPTVSSSANLAATQQQQAQQLQLQVQQQQEQPHQQYQQFQQQQQQQQQSAGSTPGHSRSTSDGALAGFTGMSSSRTGSGNLLSLLKQQQHAGRSHGGGMAIAAAPVAPSMPRAEMTLLPAAMQQRCAGVCAWDVWLRPSAGPQQRALAAAMRAASRSAASPRARLWTPAASRVPPSLFGSTRRVHGEPVTDILFTEEAIFTACSSGSIKCWLRPQVAEEMAKQQQQQQQQQHMVQRP